MTKSVFNQQNYAQARNTIKKQITTKMSNAKNCDIFYNNIVTKVFLIYKTTQRPGTPSRNRSQQRCPMLKIV
jgi:hypothetical protein